MKDEPRMSNVRSILVDKSITPTGGWVFHDPFTDKTICGANFDHLVIRVRGHRQINHIAVSDELAWEIEHQLAERCPEGMRKTIWFTKPDLQISTETPNQKVLILQKVFKETGASIVPLEEAIRRARVCRYCINNVSRACLECNGVMKWIRSTMGVAETDEDKYLHTCDIHGIYNKAQVHLPVEVFRKLMKPEAALMYPVNCWKRTLFGPVHEIERNSDEKENYEA